MHLILQYLDFRFSLYSPEVGFSTGQIQFRHTPSGDCSLEQPYIEIGSEDELKQRVFVKLSLRIFGRKSSLESLAEGAEQTTYHGGSIVSAFRLDL
jgi:hypothetical protein|eukprot:scaffold2372_cov198-Alexandrium_tamarense.AAC.11